MKHPFEDLIESGYVTITMKVRDSELAMNSLCREFVEASSGGSGVKFEGFEFFHVKVGTEARIENLKADIMRVLNDHTRLL